MLNTYPSNKTLRLGGTSSGNTVDSITWPTINNQLFIRKQGTGTWEIESNLNVDDGRLYVDDGTMIASGTTNFFSHLIDVGDGSGAAGSAKLVAQGSWTINDSREEFTIRSDGVIAPGASVGTLNLDWNSNNGQAGTVDFLNGSIYEWEIGTGNATDIFNVERGNAPSGALNINNMNLQVLDVGAGLVSASDQLTVFTYGAGVTPTIGTPTFDISSLSAEWGGTPSLVDGGSGTIYLTGLYKNPDLGGYVWTGSGGGTWSSTNWTDPDTNPDQSWADYGTATFNSPSANIVLDQAITVRGLDFNSVDHTIAASGNPVHTLSFLVDGDEINVDGGTTATIQAPFAGSTNILKSGSGTLAVTGNSTGFTGSLSANDGTVVVNGTLPGAVTVGDGIGGPEVTLKGSGSIGSVTINDNGTLAVGNSPGTMTVGELTFIVGSDMEWEFAGTALGDYDRTVVSSGLGSGNLTFPVGSGVVNLILTPFGNPVIYQGDSFTLFTYDGTLSNFDADTFNIVLAGDLSKWTDWDPTFTFGSGVITMSGIEYIPEPSTVVLAGLGLIGSCFRRRRRK